MFDKVACVFISDYIYSVFTSSWSIDHEQQSLL